MLNHHTRLVLISLAAFVLLAVVHTWPLASAPSHWSRIDGDGGINTWAVAWVAHALIEQPTRLFDGNIFYPQPLTLAYSEAILVPSLFAVPVIASGGSAVLAYSVAVFAGFVLTGWGFCLLIWRWTGSWTAGLVAGSLAAFNAYSLVNFTHLQFLHTGFVAAMLFSLDRLIVSPRFRDAWWLAAAFALQAMVSLYLMVFSVYALAFAFLARAGEWIKRAAPVLTRLAAAAAIAIVILGPYLWPYWRVSQAMNFSRAADEASAASWQNYLSTASNLHYEWWSRAIGGGSSTSVFPGVVAVVLIAVALVDSHQRRDPRLRMALAAAAGCVVMSFAPMLPFYELMHRAMPLLSMIRAVDRFGHVALLFIAVAAGFGVAALYRRWHQQRWWPALAAALVLVVNGEAFRAPIGYVWFDGVPAAYDVLAEESGAVVAEAPFPMPQQWFLNAPYMVYSTRHWHPILNGYSGFRPPSYERSYEAMRGFPSDESLLRLFELGVTHVVVHQRAMNNGQPDDRYDPYENVASLRLLKRDEDVLVYKLLRR